MEAALLDWHVRELCREQHLGLVELAVEIGVSKTYLYDVMRGRTDLRVGHLALLARRLRVRPWDLVTFQEFGPPCAGEVPAPWPLWTRT